MIRNRLITPVTFVKMKYTPMLAGIGGTTPYKPLTPLGSGNVFGALFMAGNDTYDPDTQSTGGQPTGHDQWYAFYSKGAVISSKIKVEFLNNNSIAHFKVGVVPSQGTTWTPVSETPTDWPGAKSAVIGPYVGGNNVRTIVNYYRTNTQWGVSSQAVKDDEEYSQTFNNSPAKPWYWMLYAIPCDGSAATGANVVAMMEITYYVKMSDRIELPIS